MWIDVICLFLNRKKINVQLFDESIRKIHGDSMSITEITSKPDDLDFENFRDPDDTTSSTLVIPEEDHVDATGKLVYNKPFTEKIIHTEILLPQYEITSSKVKGWTKDISGKVVGNFDSNPLLNSIFMMWNSPLEW